MTTAKAKKPGTEDEIITLYMEHVLEHEQHPTSIYKFCKSYKMKEDEFYALFGSFELLQQRIWERFYEVTMDLVEKDKNFVKMDNKDKMLTFFFTFFEMLTANRSYVLYELSPIKGMLKNAKQLNSLRKRTKDFAAELIENANDEKQLRITKQPVGLFSEGAWVQLLLLMQFWMNDSSKGFEKTDAAIEKSVKTVFALFDSNTLDTVIDLGKFLWKERSI